MIKKLIKKQRIICPKCMSTIWVLGNDIYYTCPNCGCYFQVRNLTKEEQDSALESTGCGYGYEWWKEE
jgi:predicted RNA-binding Zn-ribbon protein involved in translation (DUF1610 family)